MFGIKVFPSLLLYWNIQLLNISSGAHMTNPDPQENSSFFAERSWNGRWLHSRLAVILIPCWAREQPLVHCVTNIFELNIHGVRGMAHTLHLLHCHYSELAIKTMQNPPPFPPSPFNGCSEMGLADRRGWIPYQQSSLHPAHLLKWGACAWLGFNGLC